MRANYDDEVNALYVYTGNKNDVYFTVQEKYYYVDYDEYGDVIGYEFLLNEPLYVYPGELSE